MDFIPPYPAPEGQRWEIDLAKIGTRGYPRHWKELGYEPPLRLVDVETTEPPNEEATA